MMHKLRNKLSENAKLAVYKALIESHIRYGVSVWGTAAYRAPEVPYLLSHVKASSGLSTALSTLETYWNLTEGRFYLLICLEIRRFGNSGSRRC
ncbi:hypothetical protein J6590_060566 [Homalodisca vitripennis]|nr:hypothetical protein J6590_060566 [Homalodisca vitripennis]